MPTEEDVIVAEIISARSRGLNDSVSGRIDCLIRPLTKLEQALANSPAKLLDPFVVAELAPSTGLPSPEWQVLREEEALVVAMLTLTGSLGLERIPVEQALRMARGFLSSFSTAARFFTNLKYDFPQDVFDFHRGWANTGPRGGWTARGRPLLGSLECGLIAMDERRIGIFWVTDED
jgi:hypothetical protein